MTEFVRLESLVPTKLRFCILEFDDDVTSGFFFFRFDGLLLRMSFICTVAPVITRALKSCRNVTATVVLCYSLSHIRPLLKGIHLPLTVGFLYLSSSSVVKQFNNFTIKFVNEQLKYSWFNLLIEWKSILLFRVVFPLHQLGEPIPLMPNSN